MNPLERANRVREGRERLGVYFRICHEPDVSEAWPDDLVLDFVERDDRVTAMIAEDMERLVWAIPNTTTMERVS